MPFPLRLIMVYLVYCAPRPEMDVPGTLVGDRATADLRRMTAAPAAESQRPDVTSVAEAIGAFVVNFSKNVTQAWALCAFQVRLEA